MAASADPPASRRGNVGEWSRVSPRATVGHGCQIGEFTIIHGDVVLGEGSRVESHCILGHASPLAEGEPLVIGAGAHIRSHSVFYQGSEFGEGLVTGHRVTVRERIRAGRSLQIGSLGDFQGHAAIGDHVRTHSNVFIAQHAKVGNYVWMFPRVVLTDDPHPPSEVRRGVTVEDFAAIGAASTILPGVRVGARSLVAAHSLVTRDVAPDTVVGGVPAKFLYETSKVVHKESGRPAYPWVRHFHRGYPPEAVAEWKRQFPSG